MHSMPTVDPASFASDRLRRLWRIVKGWIAGGRRVVAAVAGGALSRPAGGAGVASAGWPPLPRTRLGVPKPLGLLGQAPAVEAGPLPRGSRQEGKRGRNDPPVRVSVVY